jgi:hypothetical protein
MNCEPGSPFDSIESAHGFVVLLGEVVADSKRDIEADVKRESNANASRRLEALQLALYNLDKLEQHIHKSCRILNDLRSIRRLLFEERGARPVPLLAKPAPPVKTPTPVNVFHLEPIPPAPAPRGGIAAP